MENSKKTQITKIVTKIADELSPSAILFVHTRTYKLVKHIVIVVHVLRNLKCYLLYVIVLFGKYRRREKTNSITWCYDLRP